MMHGKFELVGDGTFGMYSIKQEGSGTVPTVLKGMFTNKLNAMKAIDIYESIKAATASLKKVKQNGKATSTD